MSYIGSTPTTQAFTPQVDYFSGNGSTTAFTLSRPVVTVVQVEAVIENVVQNPSSAYTVSGNVVTFTSAPPAGTNNIYVRYTSPITQVVQPSQGTVDSNAIATGFGLVPAGAIMNFAMNSAPTGWLVCNGVAVSRTGYSNLFTAISTTFGVGDGSTTFNLPNLGGQFIRNWASGQSVDSGRSFGSSQTDAMQGHTHTLNAEPYMTFYPSGGGMSAGGGARFTAPTIGGIASDGTNGTPRTAAETRPTNIALLACIKA